MVDLGPATEHEMVLAFLRAEVDSSRFGKYYQGAVDGLTESGLGRGTLLDSADLRSDQHNAIRKAILSGVRGYGVGQRLFVNFPSDVTWRRVTLGPEDFGKLMYANWDGWIKLSGGTRRVIDGAANIYSVDLGDGTNDLILAMAADLKAGRTFPQLIAAAGENGNVILIEGHARATAYVLANSPERIECILGASPTMRNWAVY